MTAYRGARTATAFLVGIAYAHTLIGFGAPYFIARDSADSHQRLYGLLAGLGAALTIAIPYVVVITGLGLLRAIAENTSSSSTVPETEAS